jgi:hypothetical protein
MTGVFFDVKPFPKHGALGCTFGFGASYFCGGSGTTTSYSYVTLDEEAFLNCDSLILPLTLGEPNFAGVFPLISMSLNSSSSSSS